MPITTAPRELPWYRSKIIVGSLVALVCLVANKLGIANLAAADQVQLVDLILTIVGGLGGGTALVSRVTQKHAPQITGA
jgi:hypothetical protein